MKAKGKELEFISWIRRDGSGTLPIGTEWNPDKDFPKIDDMSYSDEDIFHLSCLSLTEKTFIASGFNSFVVKLKPVQEVKCVHPFKDVVNINGKNHCINCKTNI